MASTPAASPALVEPLPAALPRSLPDATSALDADTQPPAPEDDILLQPSPLSTDYHSAGPTGQPAELALDDCCHPWCFACWQPSY